MAELTLHGMLICVAGLVYASAGFTLSVLAAVITVVFGLVVPRNVRHDPVRWSSVEPRGRQMKRSPSKHKLATTNPDPTPASKHPPLQDKLSKQTSSLLRSTSIPTITLNGATPPVPPINHNVVSASEESLQQANKQANRQDCIQVENKDFTPRPKLSLANLKTHWSERKPTVHRCLSSPQLATFSTLSPSSHKNTLSDEEVTTLQRKSSIPQPTANSPSLPNEAERGHEVVNTKRSLTFTVTKRPARVRSRTQPYEAPYFFPQPVPR